MRKVKVEKDMPGAPIGRVYEISEDSMLFKIGPSTFELSGLNKLVDTGFFSCVKINSTWQKQKILLSGSCSSFGFCGLSQAQFSVFR